MLPLLLFFNWNTPSVTLSQLNYSLCYSFSTAILPLLLFLNCNAPSVTLSELHYSLCYSFSIKILILQIDQWYHSDVAAIPLIIHKTFFKNIILDEGLFEANIAKIKISVMCMFKMLWIISLSFNSYMSYNSNRSKTQSTIVGMSTIIQVLW